MASLPGTSTDTAVRVRPRNSLLKSGLIAVSAAGVPIFTVLYWLSGERGVWANVLALQLVLVSITVVLVWRHRMGFVEVSGGVLRKQALYAKTSVPVSSIARIVLAETYRGHSSETIPQFIALDERGHRLVKMRGYYWSADDMRRIADATGAPVVLESDPLTTKQWYSQFGGGAYWYEGKPRLQVAAIVLSLIVGLGLVLLFMHMLGMDVAVRSL